MDGEMKPNHIRLFLAVDADAPSVGPAEAMHSGSQNLPYVTSVRDLWCKRYETEMRGKMTSRSLIRSSARAHRSQFPFTQVYKASVGSRTSSIRSKWPIGTASKALYNISL